MTRNIQTALKIMATFSLLAATAAAAEPGPDSIMLERIGAVRMVQPDEIQQQRANNSLRGQLPREQQKN